MRSLIRNLFTISTGVLVLNFISCAGSSEIEQEATQDTLANQTVVSTPDPVGSKLVLGELELNLSPGIKLNESENASGDTLILDVDMGVNPLDLEFAIAQNTYDDLKIEQMDEMHLFISIDGKQCEPDPFLVYQSSWYILPYVLSQKFQLTTFKEENDYPFPDLDYSKLKNSAKATCGEEMASVLEGTQELGQVPHEVLTTNYYIRIEAKKADSKRIFFLIINVPTGC